MQSDDLYMKNRSQKIRLGVFLTVIIAALIFVIAFLTAREFFEKEDVYYVVYEGVSVRGLEVGSSVKYMGINVGSIDDITIDPDNVSKVIIALSLKAETPIKENAQADITSIGITGLKAIEISGGSNTARSLKPGDFIKAGTSFSSDITGRAEIIAQKVEQVLNNLLLFTQPQNLNKITELAGQATQTIQTIDSVITENRSDIRNTVAPLKEVSNRLNRSSLLMLSSMEAIHQRAQSDTIDEILANIHAVTVKLNETNIKLLIENVATIAEHTEDLLLKIDNDLDRGSQDFSESLRLLRMTLENLNAASEKINNDPSILLRGVNDKRAPDFKLND